MVRVLYSRVNIAGFPRGHEGDSQKLSTGLFSSDFSYCFFNQVHHHTLQHQLFVSVSGKKVL